MKNTYQTGRRTRLLLVILGFLFMNSTSYRLSAQRRRVSPNIIFSSIKTGDIEQESTGSLLVNAASNNEISVLTPMYPAKSTQTKDVIWEKLAIFLLSWSLACVSVDKYNAMKYVYPGMGYPQFVLVSRTLLRGTANDIKTTVVNLLLSLVPLQLRESIIEYCKDKPQWIAEKSSEFMSFGFLGWLVGPVERIVVDVPQPDGTVQQWLSGVKLKECRYLVESGCKSACLHLCKGPTQAFFNEELGMKLHMKPDFTDCSCEMIFGIDPPTADSDPAYGEPCFSTCSMSALKPKSKKIKEDPSSQFNKCS